MALREGYMWRENVRPALQRAGLDPLRVENKVASGTPDVNYMDGWLELKCVDRWPARGGALALPHFTKEQRIFLRTRWQRGGNAWLLLKVVKTRDWLLFDGATAAELLGKGADHAALELRAAAVAKSFDPSVFVPWLKGEEGLPGGALARYYRLRCGQTPEVTAREAGISLTDLINMETGAAEPHVLLDHWQS